MNNNTIITKEMLEKLYITEQKSAKEIGVIFGLSCGAILKKIQKYNIPKRTRSQQNKITFNRIRFKCGKVNKLNVTREEVEKLYLIENKTLQEIGGTRKNKSYRRGPYWNVIAESIRQRDNYTCQHCGKQQKIDGRKFPVHHKIPFRYFGLKNYQLANSFANLITCCSSSHGILEGEFDKQANFLRLIPEDFIEFDKDGNALFVK